jgi:peptidoglycan/LPS O-acetylase OafA/YrhL
MVGEEGTLRRWFAGAYELGDINSPKRNLPMEGLRGLAVILVFFVHYHGLIGRWLSEDTPSFAVSYFLSSIGHSGVDLFFVLSGYLIYGAVLSKRTRYLTFIKRRIERIYPAFLCVLAIYLVLSALFPSESKIPARPLEAILYILANLLLLPGIFPVTPLIAVAWSLSYEFFYYLLIPLIVMVFGMQRWTRLRRVVFFVGLSILYMGVCVFGLSPHPGLIMFVAGILLYEARHSYELGKLISPHTDYFVLLLLACTFPLIYMLTDRQELLPWWFKPGHFGLFYRKSLLFVSFFVFTFTCFDSRGLLKRIFSWRPLRWLGNMSYSYYLIHALTVNAVATGLAHIRPPENKSQVLFWALLLPVFFLTLVSSTLLFLFVERRFSFAPTATKELQPTPMLHSVSVPPDV